LGLHRSEEAFKFLLNRVASNNEPLRARPGAINGLMTSAKWQTEQQKDQAIEEIGKLIRDLYPSVRASAVGALVSLEAKSYAGKVSVTRPMYSEADHGWLNRAIASLKKNGSSSQDNQQEETIKKLEDRLKKLEDKLARQADKE
jgi:predicted ribosome quality control (RQC) complex YloA/Tae2 family protein